MKLILSIDKYEYLKRKITKINRIEYCTQQLQNALPPKKIFLKINHRLGHKAQPISKNISIYLENSYINFGQSRLQSRKHY